MSQSTKPETTKTPTWDQHVRPFDLVHSQRVEANHARGKLLRKDGWKYTCDTPGSLWMWEKQMPDGRTLLVSADTAFQFARHDAISRVDPSEMED